MAADLLATPIAIVSLVDTDRIWFKSHYGLEIHELERAPGLCASAIYSDHPYIITDGRTGYNLGTLCCLDFQPCELTAQQSVILENLAQMMMDQMELHLQARQIHELKEAEFKANAFNVSILNSLTTQLCVLDVNGIIIRVNKAWLKFGQQHGLSDSYYELSAYWRVFPAVRAQLFSLAELELSVPCSGNAMPESTTAGNAKPQLGSQSDYAELELSAPGNTPLELT